MAICGYLPLVAHLISVMILTASRNKLDCSPARPFLFPAIERFWQGEPKVITSTGSISAPFIRVMFPRWAMFGNRDFVTAMGNGSISLAHAGTIPTAEAARGHVPLPSNRLPSFMSCVLQIVHNLVIAVADQLNIGLVPIFLSRNRIKEVIIN